MKKKEIYKTSLSLPIDLRTKAEERMQNVYISSFNEYIKQLIKLDVQKKILK